MPADVAERFQVPGSWEFTPEVAAVFDSHVEASVPHYPEIQRLVAEAADWLAPAGATVVDLGAATGTTADLIAARHPERGYQFHLYDRSEAMLNQAKAKLAGYPNADVHLHCGALEAGLEHGYATLTLALFTLQFLDPADRQALLQKARAASREQGALLAAEKLRLRDSRWQTIASAVSADWKAERGIGPDAIHAKERALRGVLVPQTDLENRRMLEGAGWHEVEVLFRWHSWAVYGAFAS